MLSTGPLAGSGLQWSFDVRSHRPRSLAANVLLSTGQCLRASFRTLLEAVVRHGDGNDPVNLGRTT